MNDRLRNVNRGWLCIPLIDLLRFGYLQWSVLCGKLSAFEEQKWQKIRFTEATKKEIVGKEISLSLCTCRGATFTLHCFLGKSGLQCFWQAL